MVNDSGKWCPFGGERFIICDLFHFQIKLKSIKMTHFFWVFTDSHHFGNIIVFFLNLVTVTNFSLVIKGFSHLSFTQGIFYAKYSVTFEESPEHLLQSVPSLFPSGVSLSRGVGFSVLISSSSGEI